MTTTGELIHPPVPIPVPVRAKVQVVHPPAQHAKPTPWPHRIYRIWSHVPEEDFVYGADGFKRMKPARGEHIDLYA